MGGGGRGGEGGGGARFRSPCDRLCHLMGSMLGHSHFGLLTLAWVHAVQLLRGFFLIARLTASCKDFVCGKRTESPGCAKASASRNHGSSTSADNTFFDSHLHAWTNPYLPSCAHGQLEHRPPRKLSKDFHCWFLQDKMHAQMQVGSYELRSADEHAAHMSNPPPPSPRIKHPPPVTACSHSSIPIKTHGVSGTFLTTLPS